MKNYLVLFGILLSTAAFGDEVVSLNSDINILKCQRQCFTPVREGKPIQISLQPLSEGSMTSRGEYSLVKSIDGYTFTETIVVNKLTTPTITKYLIQVYLLSAKGDESNQQSLGNVVVNDLSSLNSVTWKNTVKNNDDNYIVSIVVGSASDR